MIIAVSSRPTTEMVSLAAKSLSSVFSLKTVQIAFLVVFCLFRVTHADDNDQEEDICPDEVSVDLTNATSNDSGFQTVNGLFFPRGSATFRAGIWRGCICDVKPCIAFCPPWNMTSNKSSDVAEDYLKHSAIPRIDMTNLILVDEERAPSLEQRFHIFNWNPCPFDKDAYFLEPEKYQDEEYHILENGSLFSPYFVDSISQSLDFREYCLRKRGDNTVYTPVICSSGERPVDVGVVLDKIKYVGFLVAVPFLIATVVVYSVLPELRNIHGKTLRCYLSCVILAYVALAADRLPAADISAGVLCLCLGFTIYSSLLASFLWLNVMCFDIWWRFRWLGSFRSYSDRKIFVAYSTYAWGITAVMSAICIGMEFSPAIPESMIRPGFKEWACWFEPKETPGVLYFYGPIGVTIACNMCLFISTSIEVFKHNKDTQRHLNRGESRRHDEKKQWFNLHLKLFIVMGVTWSTEIISSVCEGPEYLWFVTDLVNAIQGILIFVIFVCKENIWRSLKDRYRHKVQVCISASRDSWSGLRAIANTKESRISSSNSEDPLQMSRTETSDRAEVAKGSYKSYEVLRMRSLSTEESQ